MNARIFPLRMEISYLPALPAVETNFLMNESQRLCIHFNVTKNIIKSPYMPPIHHYIYSP